MSNEGVQENERAILMAGPTASGKSEMAMLLAEQIGGEIISVDSMQVYRGLDIGTAKPSHADLQRVPHHLVSILDLHQSFDAAQFLRLARAAAESIRSRGKIPILCGGTGLYFRTFLEGLGSAPPADPVLRKTLESSPVPDLLAELAAKDPVAYEKIDRQNLRRVIRAIEVIRLTGQPFSAQKSQWTDMTNHLAARNFFGLRRESGDLKERIDQRVDSMFQKGLVAETEALLKNGLAQNPTARQALGYKQIIERLEGQHTLAQTIELVKIRTRQFAKRQMTWFRRQRDIQWVPVQKCSDLKRVLHETILPQIAERL
jgi:tRNA dimethylallyltransferase